MTDLPRFQLYIDGAFTDAEGGATYESLSPATAAPWAIMPAAGEGDVDRAVAAARRAFNEGDWPAMTASARGALLYNLADILAARAGELAELETRDTGKIIRETMGQTGYAAAYYRYFAGLADKIEGSTLPIDKPDMEVSTRREPLGVVAAIVPWNSQLFLSAVKLGPALAAGNTVVLKASEDGPAPLLKFAELIQEAGFPPGVVNIITGMGEPCGRALTSHPDVNRVAFTGGPATARRVVENTANNLAMTTLELGGKSPVVVFGDADIESATNGVIAGIFGASGQSCVAGSRLLVEASVHDEIVDRLASRAPEIVLGDPLDQATEMGPLATERQLANIERVVAASIEAGAEVATGGARPNELAPGWYYPPTVLTCPSQDLPAPATELFGPVLSVIKFADEDQAVQMANATPYGLASGVFTRNLARGTRMTRRLRAGIVWVNTYRAVSPVAPFGGFGHSGYGRESGMDAIHDYTRTKTVWVNASDEPMPDPFVMR